MNALLIIAHGSRRDASNQEVLDLSDSLTKRAGEHFDIIKACFLELAEPGIEAAIDECAAKGAQQITVLPYFLSAGRHVVSDVPREIEAASGKHTQLRISVCPHIGALSTIPDLLLETALLGRDQQNLEDLPAGTEAT